MGRVRGRGRWSRGRGIEGVGRGEWVGGREGWRFCVWLDISFSFSFCCGFMIYIWLSPAILTLEKWGLGRGILNGGFCLELRVSCMKGCLAGVSFFFPYLMCLSAHGGLFLIMSLSAILFPAS